MAVGINQLKGQFHDLETAIAPTVLQVFRDTLNQINQILPEITPLAKAGGQALGGLITQLGGAFTDSQGQQFFAFVEHNLGPDVQAIGTLAVQLLHTVFSLIEGLQPLSLSLIHVIGGIATGLADLTQHAPLLTAVAISAIALYKPIAALAGLDIAGFFAPAVKYIKDFIAATEGATIAEKSFFAAELAVDAASPFAWVAGAALVLGTLAFALTHGTNGLNDFTSNLQKQDGAVGFNIKGLQDYSNALDNTSIHQIAAASDQGRVREGLYQNGIAQRQLTQDQVNASAAVTHLTQNLGDIQAQYGLTQQGAIRFAQAAGVQAKDLEGTGVSAQDAFKKLEAYGQAEDETTGITNGMTFSVNALTTAFTNQVQPILTLQGDQIAWRQSLEAATKQLDSNSAGLKGNSANALANKQALLNATNQVFTFANEQISAKGNLHAASNEILAQIDYLQKHGDKSHFAAQEIHALRVEESLIKKDITSDINVDGKGKWTVTGGSGPVTGPSPGGHHLTADGWFVSGGTPGVDSVPILAKAGELVVPEPMVSAGAVDHLRGTIPGFDSGGVVGGVTSTFSGNPGALGAWARQQQIATLHAIQASVAAATLAGAQAAAAAATQRLPGGDLGAHGGSAAANQALARKLLPLFGFGQDQMVPLIELWNQESGWNQFADNVSSGAYGIPQSLPASKMAAAGPDYLTNPLTQERWGLGYIKGRYGTPAGAWAHERAFNWYDDGGWMPPGGVGFNGTSKPEPVFSGAQWDILRGASGGHGQGRSGRDRQLDSLIRATNNAPAAMGKAFADSLNGVAHRAVYNSLYSAV